MNLDKNEKVIRTGTLHEDSKKIVGLSPFTSIKQKGGLVG